MAQATTYAMSISQAALACGLSRSTLFLLISQGDLPSVKVGHRRLILTQDLEEFLRRHRTVAGQMALPKNG